MSLNEWKAIGIFGLAVYALSFFSTNAAIFLLVTVGLAAFVTRASKQQQTNPSPAASGGSGVK